MTRKLMTTLLGMALMVGLLQAQPAVETPAVATQVRPMKIGYVDITMVLKNYDRRKALEETLRDYEQRLTSKERAMIQQIEKYKAEMEQLAMGTPERADLDRKISLAARDAEEMRRKDVADLNARLVDTISGLYGEIRAQIEKIGSEEGYDFIFKDQSREGKDTSYNNVVLQISQRIVLYSKAEYNLTERVTRLLNDAYAAKQAEAAKDEAKPAAVPAAEKPSVAPSAKEK